jgi:hypothetical protein
MEIWGTLWCPREVSAVAVDARREDAVHSHLIADRPDGSGVRALRQMIEPPASTVKPTAAKTCASKALHDVGTSLDRLPDKLGVKIFNHYQHRTLIQSEDPRRRPGVQIACVRIGWIVTGNQPIRATA